MIKQLKAEKEFKKKMSEKLVVTYKWLNEEKVYIEKMNRIGLNNLVVNCWDIVIIKVEKVEK